jgi:hypothetical protein
MSLLFHDDGCPVAKNFGHTIHNLSGIIPHANDGIGAHLSGVIDHHLKSIGARLLA